MVKIRSVVTGLALAFATLCTSSFAQDRPIQPTRLLAQTTQTAPSACPLPAAIAITFLRSECKAVVLQEPRTYYRYYSSSSNRYGRYLTTDRYAKSVEAIANLALKQEWGNQATIMLEVTLPAGTTVYEGIVAPQDPAACYPGGGQQTFIENSKDPNIVWSDGTPMQVDEFKCSQ